MLLPVSTIRSKRRPGEPRQTSVEYCRGRACKACDESVRETSMMVGAIGAGLACSAAHIAQRMQRAGKHAIDAQLAAVKLLARQDVGEGRVAEQAHAPEGCSPPPARRSRSYRIVREKVKKRICGLAGYRLYNRAGYISYKGFVRIRHGCDPGGGGPPKINCSRSFNFVLRMFGQIRWIQGSIAYCNSSDSSHKAGFHFLYKKASPFVRSLASGPWTRRQGRSHSHHRSCTHGRTRVVTCRRRGAACSSGCPRVLVP